MRRFMFTVLAAGLLAGCEPSAGPLANNEDPGLKLPALAGVILPPSGANGVANLEEFELCKYGSSATFSYSVYDRGAGTTTNGTVSLSDGDCRVIALFGGFGADVTVTETAAQSGFQLDRVDVTIVTPGGTSSYTQTSPTVTETVAGSGGPTGLRGALAEFYNVGIPFGGEGCTPGYWKQPHHFDSWPAPYQPSDLFSAYFDDAFPGMTLLEVLSQGGGKLIALGRHTVAALLNAASSGVNYNLSATDVVNAFNAAYPGTDRAYNQLKEQFAGYNEQGCPLN